MEHGESNYSDDCVETMKTNEAMTARLPEHRKTLVRQFLFWMMIVDRFRHHDAWGEEEMGRK